MRNWQNVLTLQARSQKMEINRSRANVRKCVRFQFYVQYIGRSQKKFFVKTFSIIYLWKYQIIDFSVLMVVSEALFFPQSGVDSLEGGSRLGLAQPAVANYFPQVLGAIFRSWQPRDLSKRGAFLIEGHHALDHLLIGHRIERSFAAKGIH